MKALEMKHQLYFLTEVLAPLRGKLGKEVYISGEAVCDSELPSNKGILTNIYYEANDNNTENHLESFNDYATITFADGSTGVVGTHELRETPIERKEVDGILCSMWIGMGMDVPMNHEDILEFCHNDVLETADENEWHSGDVTIAFRRYLEKDIEN